MATRTISVAGGNWNATSAWDEAAVPIAGDAVVARGGGDSGNVTVNVASACASIILTNYTGTLTYNNTLTTTSTVTYPAGMTVAGTSDHVTVTTSTITIACASGLTGGLRLGGSSQTYTLGSDWAIGGTLLFNGTNAVIFSGAHNITCAALSDTMTVSAITMSGNITVAGDAAFSSATSTTITGGFAFGAATCTVSGSQTVTITGIGSMTITGLTTSSTANVFNGGTWNTGGLSVTGATTGTTVFNLTGGTWSGSAALSCSVTIAGNVTLSGTILYSASGTPTLTYASGTVTVAGSTLSIASSCTLNTAGMTFDAISLTGAATLTVSSALAAATMTVAAATTLTLNGALTISGTFTGPNAALTFGGSAGWTIGTYTNTAISATRVTTFTAARTYRITTALNLGHAAAQTVRYTWTAASTANIVLGPGATRDVGFCDPTNLDASGGQLIFTYKGVVTTSPNWSSALRAGLQTQYPVAQIGV